MAFVEDRSRSQSQIMIGITVPGIAQELSAGQVAMGTTLPGFSFRFCGSSGKT